MLILMIILIGAMVSVCLIAELWFYKNGIDYLSDNNYIRRKFMPWRYDEKPPREYRE